MPKQLPRTRELLIELLDNTDRDGAAHMLRVNHSFAADAIDRGDMETASVHLELDQFIYGELRKRWPQ